MNLRQRGGERRNVLTAARRLNLKGIPNDENLSKFSSSLCVNRAEEPGNANTDSKEWRTGEQTHLLPSGTFNNLSSLIQANISERVSLQDEEGLFLNLIQSNVTGVYSK